MNKTTLILELLETGLLRVYEAVNIASMIVDNLEKEIVNYNGENYNG